MADNHHPPRETHTTHTVETRSVEGTSGKPRTGMVLALAVLVLLLAGVGIFYAWKRKKTATTPTDTADQIRNAFNPPTTTQPSFVPPSPSPQFSGSGSTSTSTAGNTNSGIGYDTATGSGRANTTPGAGRGSTGGAAGQNNPGAVAGVTTYQNSSLGFQVAVPGTWTASQSGNTIFFHDRSTGMPQGAVEAYPNDGSTLEDLRRMLEGSTSVQNITSASVDGQPALRYNANTSAGSGIAYIANNKIYYLHGAFMDPNINSSFRSTASAAAGINQNSSSQNVGSYQNTGTGNNSANYPGSSPIY